MTGGLCSPNAYLLVCAFFALSAAVHLAIGLPAAHALRERRWVPREMYLLAAIGVTALIAYTLFWAWLWKPAVGRLGTLGLLLITAIALADPATRARLRAALQEPDVRWPAALMLLLGFFYIGLTYVVTPEGACARANQGFVAERLVGGGSPDYLIQKIWADGVSRGNPPWNNVLDPDLSRTTVADRPPLLASFALLLYPLVPDNARFLYFMAATSAASLAWVAALWALLRIATVPVTGAVIGVLAASQTYYFWYSSIFSWPKALSGAMVSGAVLLLIAGRLGNRAPQPIATTVIAAIFAALALVAHFSAGLLIFVIGLTLLHPRFFPGWRASIAAALAFVAIAGSYYQAKSVNERNVSNLTKYTLSVPDTMPVEPPEYKGLSTSEAMRRAYGSISFGEAAAYKLYNIRQIFNGGCFLACPGKSTKESLWSSELHPIIGSMKLLNIGWLLFLVPLALCIPLAANFGARIAALLPPATARATSRAYALLAFAGLVFYGLLTFRQGVSNIVSSGFMLLLFAAVLIRLTMLPRRWAWLTLAAPALYFGVLVASATFEESSMRLNPALLAILVTSAVAICAAALYAARAHQPASSPA